VGRKEGGERSVCVHVCLCVYVGVSVTFIHHIQNSSKKRYTNIMLNMKIHTWIVAVMMDEHIGLHHGSDGNHEVFFVHCLFLALSRVG